MELEDTGRLYERVSRDLAGRIAAGEYPVGQRLPAERALAQAYAVSRPTIREAIFALELDGLVEARMGSGVYVISRLPQEGEAVKNDIGPFELIEARRLIEGEACALAAARITDAEIEALAALVDEMRDADRLAAAEDADRRFHLAIARATQNSAMVAAVDMLWDARARSPQYQIMSGRAHAAGIGPRADEHARILDALRLRQPDPARAAMRDHLTQVLESVLAATEVQEMEQARARIEAHRLKYGTSA